MNDAEIRFVGEMTRIVPQPGDVFVLTSQHPIDMQTTEYLREGLLKALGSDVKVLVLGDGLKLEVMSQQDAEQVQG